MAIEVNDTNIYYRPKAPLTERISKPIRQATVFFHDRAWKNGFETFALSSQIMTDINLSDLQIENDGRLENFYQQIMYFNELLDPLTRRFQNGGKSAEFVESFWGLSKQLDKTNNPSARSWFQLNRLLNMASYDINNGNALDWKKYTNGNGDYGPSILSSKLQKTFDSWEDGDTTAKIILFRTLSSVGFTKALIAFPNSNGVTTKEQCGSILRIGAMTMIMQTIDDYWKMARDARKGVAGISQSLAMNLKLKDIITANRQIIAGCLDVVNVDPNVSVKNSIVHCGLIGTTIFRVLTHFNEAKRNTIHNKNWFSESAIQSLVEIFRKGDKDNYYRKTTSDALFLSAKTLLN